APASVSRRVISLVLITFIFIGTTAVWTYKFFTAFPEDTVDTRSKAQTPQSSLLPDDFEGVTSLGAVKGLLNDAMLNNDRTLEVGDINFTPDCLEEIAKHKMLLGIVFRHAGTIDDRVFNYIQDIPLKYLDLCDTQITDFGLTKLSNMKTV